MDDTQGSRMSDAVATRKRRSSILKNQRPPRTPFSELEFNVATPTDTAKSRRVSFSRRTDVAEFVTNEATTTWKTMYVEQNRSLESSGNESVMHQPQPTVGCLGKRAIFEQQFQEEAVDFGMLTPNPRVHEMNMSLMNINFSQQIADLEREDMKFSAPQKLELSSFTEDKSKLFGELTAAVTGVSNKIEVDFSAIQPVGDKCDDLDEIQRDLLGGNPGQALRRPFDSPDASEYIEVDLNTTHIGLKRDTSDMSITDSIRSPVKGIPQENLSLKRDNPSSKKNWTADKENIAFNPYIAPRESANFAINEMPDQVLVFDGRKLSVQTERQSFDRNGQPISSNKPPAQKKSIVLNVNDDLPNFADDASLGQVHGLSTSKIDNKTHDPCQTNAVSSPTELGLNSHKTVLYDNLADVSVTQAIPTNILEKEKRMTIVFENDGGELSMTQALPSNFAKRSDVTQNRTVVYSGEEISFTEALPANVLSQPKDVAPQNRTVVYSGEEISFTEALPANVLSQPKDVAPQNRTVVYSGEEISFIEALPANVFSQPKDVAPQNRTVVYGSKDVSFTQALPNNVLLANKSDKRNTTVYGNDAGDISITRVLPSNIIVCGNLKPEESVIPENSRSLHKTIFYDISMTEAVPKNIILANDTKIDHADDGNNISETKMIPSNIFQYDGLLLEESKRELNGDVDSLKGSDKISSNMSMTEAIPETVLLPDLTSKRKTIDAVNMSVTRVLPTNIISTESTMVDVCNDFSITQAVPDNIVILNDIQKSDPIKKTDPKNKTVDLSQKEGVGTVTESNATSNENVPVAELVERELLSKSFAKIDLSRSKMDISVMREAATNDEENLLEKSQLQENKCLIICSEGTSNVSVVNIKTIDIQLNGSETDQKAEESRSNAPISDYKTVYVQKVLDASSNAKSIFSKSMSLVEEHGSIFDKDKSSRKSYANILETSKHGDDDEEFDIVAAGNEKLREISFKQSEILPTSQKERDGSELLLSPEKNTQKSSTEMSFRDVLVYQAVTNHNVSKQMKNTDNVPPVPQTDVSLMDIDPKSITLINAINTGESKIDDTNISKNKTLLTDIVGLNKKGVSIKEKQTDSDRFDNLDSDVTISGVVPENFLISPKRKTLDLTDVEVNHKDVVMDSPLRNDFTFPQEELSRIGTIHDASTTREKLRKSDVFEETSENTLTTCLNKRKTIHGTDVKDAHRSLDIESTQQSNNDMESEQEEQYSGISTIYNAFTTQQKQKKIGLKAETSDGQLISRLNKRKTLDQTGDRNEHGDIVMESPKHINITQEKQYSSISTINNTSTVRHKPKKSILSELLKMSDDSINMSADSMGNECEISEKEMQDLLRNTEYDETHKNDEEVRGKKTDISLKVTDVSQPKVDMLEQENGAGNCVSSPLNDERKQSKENTFTDIDNKEMKKDEFTVDKAKLTPEHHYKEADNTKELLEMLSDFTDKTIIKETNKPPTEGDVEQVAVNKISNSYEPSRLSLAKSRMSTVLSREDLLINISMAYAALQQARSDTDESDIEDTLDDSAEDQIEHVEPEEVEAADEIDEAIAELDYRRRSVRSSTEVIKTLQFDDTATDVNLKSDDNLSPLRKSVYGDISQRVDSRARVIPSFEVSDEVKLLMQDLVKPMADDTVFGKTGPEKSTKSTNSMRSINIQANIITSSQIDIDMDSASGIVSVDVQTEPEYFQNDIIQSPEPVKERNSDRIRQSPPVVTFDPANPLNNVVLPDGNTEIHKYSPHKSPVSRVQEILQSSPTKSILEKNPEEYNIQRVSTNYEIETSAFVLDTTKEKDFRHRQSSNTLDDNFDTQIKDSEMNTVLAMKCNKELLEETSCLTLVDDQEPIEIEDSQLDLVQPQKIDMTSPLRVIFKTDVRDDTYTSSVDLDSDDSKPKKRIYSPAKPDPSKKVLMSNADLTPKPLNKIQKLSNTPNNAKRSIKHQTESLNKSNVKYNDEKAVSPKVKYGGTVIVQQMAECKIDSDMDAASSSGMCEHSSCTLKASRSLRYPETASSEDTCCMNPLSLSLDSNLKTRELHVLSERESCANILEKMDSLSFMGGEDCQWDLSDASTWRFRLLRGRLLLTVDLGHVTGNRSRERFARGCGHVRADTPVLSARVDLVGEEPDVLSRTCVCLASEAMRYECVRAIGSVRSVPKLLKRCVAVARVAGSWVRVMADARMHLAYALTDGTLTLNVANIPLRAIYEVSFRIELVVGDAREAAWPRAEGVCVRDVTSVYTRHGSRHATAVTPCFEAEVQKLLTRVPHDWGHVPRTLWKVFRYLKNKSKDDEWFGDLPLRRP